MHRRLGFARGARSESQQRDVVAPRSHGVEFHRLVQRYPVEFGVMVGRAVEIHHLLEKAAGLRAGDQLIGDAAVGQRQRNLGLVDDLAQLAGTQHRHGVDDDGAGFCRRKPGRDQRRIVARADQDTVAGFDAVILHQRVREAVGPVGQFLVSALTAVADQCDPVAPASFDDTVGQFDRGIQIFRVLKLWAVEQQVRPLF
jgi:hypothetical protein